MAIIRWGQSMKFINNMRVVVARDEAGRSFIGG